MKNFPPKPRVLILIATDIIGGPGKGLFQFLKFADQKAFDYVLCNYDRSGRHFTRTDFLQKAKEEGIKVHRFSQHITLDPTLVPKAGRLIREYGLNLVQTHGYKSNILGFLLKKAFRIPWIAFAHGYTFENSKIAIYNLMDRLCYRFADRSVVVSDHLKDILLKNGVESWKITKIHNAVDLKELPMKVEPPFLRRSLGITDGLKILGVVGRLSPEKGQIIFLKAFKKIVRRTSDVKVLIIGDGPEGQYLRRFCTENGLEKMVVFTGHVTNMGDYYRLMDLLVIPSLSEGLPNVLIEAMALGIPAIASRVGAVGEVLRDMPFNTIPAGDDLVLAEKVVDFLEDSNLRIRTSEQGRRIVASSFSPAERAKRIVKLYYSTLS